MRDRTVDYKGDRTAKIAIIANTALFSVVNAVLLQSFGYADPARLVEISGLDRQGKSTGVSIPDMIAMQRRARSFERVGSSTLQMFTIAGPREPENLYGQLVSADCFQALGAVPLMGRIFSEGDFRTGAPDVAIVSYRVWQTTLDGDPGILSRPVLLNGKPHTVIGVMRPEFQYPHPVFRVWTPWRMTAENLENHLAHPFTVLARLRPGATRASAQAELDTLSQSLAREFPATNTGWHAVAARVSERALGSTRPTLLVLMGAVGFVLLIACMNVSNLLVARGIGRSREMAVRAALGATRGRIAWLMLRESMEIALCGGALGLLFAHWWLRALVLLLPDRTISILPGAEHAALDLRVLAVAAAVTVLCGVVFGLAPALRLSRTTPGDLLQEGGRGSTGGPGTAAW